MAFRLASVTEGQVFSLKEAYSIELNWNLSFYFIWLISITWLIMWLYARKGHRRFPLSIVCICCRNKTNFGSTDYSACVLYTKTIIYLSVGKMVDNCWILNNILNVALNATVEKNSNKSGLRCVYIALFISPVK